jgi:tetratricopeptide (TPR) repeat protein
MMNKLTFAVVLLCVAPWAMAQYSGTSAQQGQPSGAQAGQSAPGQSGAPGQSTPPAGSQAGAQGQSGAQPGAQGPAAPQGKRPPQAKSQEEFNAYKTAVAATDPAAGEKAADDFAAKFPNSELRTMLFRKSMQDYQNANNADKAAEMANKVLAADPDDPQALIVKAEILSEKSRPTDLDYNQKTSEALAAAQHALQTIDSDLMFAPGAPAEKVQAAKDWLRSTAYAVIGNVEMSKKDYAGAERDIRKAIDLTQNQPDPVNYLRLSVALDNQNKYPEALQAAGKAAELAPENTQVGQLARQEQNRLKQLTGTGGAPGAASNAPGNAPKPAGPPPTSPQPQTPHQ